MNEPDNNQTEGAGRLPDASCSADNTEPTTLLAAVDPATTCSAALREEAAEVLRKIRIDKQPSRRGILLCGEMMGKMLQLGWAKEDLDTFEIMFWITRDADGRLLTRLPNAEVSHGDLRQIILARESQSDTLHSSEAMRPETKPTRK